ncbi:DUF6449 domain-containing protein [Butyrivibrio sp. FCS014]|uniref:DUF6449 domain-containing protein n=1 Tax=Butyrivibrio sp. FCS014 TaxID=1408304 RepID=UPI0004678E41|nr:DUF6449 domain-containing protein [Butyrivibrio sp. FCS014]
MTSANLSLGDKLKNHRTYINRTLWTYLIAFPVLAAYMILGVIMMVSRSINYAAVYNQSAEVLKIEKLKAVTRVLGMEQLGWAIVIAIAAMFAIQSFSYVFSQSQMDFYYSQPTTRRGRIYRNYRNSMSTFMFMYVGLEIITLIIAAAMGAVNGYSLLMILIETVRVFVLFFTFYNITFLAVVLSGSLPIAIILTGCFTFVSMVVSKFIDFFKEIFYATYSNLAVGNIHLSPLSDRVHSNAILYQYINNNSDYFGMDHIKNLLSITVPDDIDVLITGIIALVFAVIFARMRKTEWAGKSIALRPFRWIVKIVVCFIAGLGSGLIVFLIYNTVWNQRLFTMMCIIMLLATFVTGCIVEVILEGNIRRFFKGIAQTVMAMAFVLLTFVIMRGDLLGYDSFVPAKDKIKSCAIVDGIYDYNFYSYYMNNNDMSDTDMEITDIDNFLTVARAGMATRKAESRLEGEDRYDSLGYNLTILYRLNSGREVYRYITVPYNEVDDALSKIIDSKEYKTGHFPVFNDDNLREADGTGSSHELRFSALGESKDTRNFDYSEFSDALRKDILEHYSFEYAKNNFAIGSIEYHNDGNRYVGLDINIYDNYTYTLDLLKKYDIYIDYKLAPDDIKEVRITNYYPGHDLETESINDIDGDIRSSEKIYNDAESIAKILESSVCGDYYNQWQDYDELYNGQYNIEIVRNTENRNSSPVYYTFYKGKVPDFVKEDTN